LRQIDFGAFIADWLRDRKRSEDLARFALRMLPEAFSATETSGLMKFITRRVTTQLLSIDLAPLAAGALRGFVQEGKHEGLLDDLLRVMHQTLTQADTMAVIRDKVRAEVLEKGDWALHAESRGTYGSPRLHAALRNEGFRIGKGRVERTLRSMGLRGRIRRRSAGAGCARNTSRSMPRASGRTA
jgi:hypothetical protein